jgi:arginine decarboxylase
LSQWSIKDSLELYDVPAWSAGFFGIRPNGHLEVRSGENEGGPSLDLYELTRDLQRRGLRLPLLLRFSNILERRIHELADAFRTASTQYGYRGKYRGVYPIKVNQQRHVVEELIRLGQDENLGLEAGSKPELLIALALLDTPDALIVCNGFKDRAYLETALLAQKLGRLPIIVIDRFRELSLLLEVAAELGVRPHIGLRAKLSSAGAGKWVDSSGERSKFGLNTREIVAAIETLKEVDMLDCVELLHFHIGSQITKIRAHKDALREASRIYVGLHQLGARPSIIDTGGGLGVDYDGSQSNTHSSTNYSVQEYANDVVSFIQEVCDETNTPHPDIVTESGRAMTAHHSMLIFDVLGVNNGLGNIANAELPSLREEDPKILHNLVEVYRTATTDNIQEVYHDALQFKDEANTLFNLGVIDIQARACAEEIFQHCCHKILSMLREMDNPPEDVDLLEKPLADTYFANFSTFQSIPDHWAVGQLFPVMPIHRLNEEPTRQGIFADLTCDSDGKINRFISPGDDKQLLELHEWNDQEPYHVGVFLIGAYQEILGDLHNLFGDTDAVHIRIEEGDRYSVDHVVEGDSVDEVLSYVQYDRKELVERVRRTIEKALREGRISLEDSALLRRRYEQGLTEYTYLSQDSMEELS